MKKVFSVLLIALMVFSMTACCIPGNESAKEDNSQKQALSDFHSKVSESQALLDAVADTIYDNWYGAIYDDDYYGNINTAIAMAQLEHSEDLEKIEALDAEISELFKTVKDGDQASLVKEIMSAYSDYYEFVVNVSGSFNSYSASKETLKKELASLLRDLSYEL